MRSQHPSSNEMLCPPTVSLESPCAHAPSFPLTAWLVCSMLVLVHTNTLEPTLTAPSLHKSYSSVGRPCWAFLVNHLRMQSLLSSSILFHPDLSQKGRAAVSSILFQLPYLAPRQLPCLLLTGASHSSPGGRWLEPRSDHAAPTLQALQELLLSI